MYGTHLPNIAASIPHGTNDVIGLAHSCFILSHRFGLCVFVIDLTRLTLVGGGGLKVLIFLVQLTLLLDLLYLSEVMAAVAVEM